MSKNTVQENINRAIQIHVENAIKGLQYNKTELVEIVDITNRDKGEYTVFNGSVKYFAYSENTKYALRDKVYVNIPNNDYSQQKIIIGKYKSGGNKTSYISPWDNFTPMTGSINTDKTIKKIDDTEKGPIQILNISSDLSKYNGYEYMGVKASFNTHFPGVNSGNYGIEIALTYKDPQVPGRTAKSKTNYYILDTNSMVGNIYNFSSFYSQEAVFKIPKDIEITEIVANFFCDEDLLKYGTISMRGLDLRFGNEKTTETDSLELYCEQGAEYNSSLGDKNDKNKKILKIKWCHYDKDEEQLKEIDKETTFLNSGEAVDLYYNIKWYHKIIKKVDGSDVNDTDKNKEKFEKDWEDITPNSTSNSSRDLDLFSREIYPTVLQKEDSFKVIIEYGPKDGNNNINTKSYFYKKLESEVYTFKNTVEIPDYTSFDFANTQIIATDDYEGNYHIYDGKNGKILKRADASKKRELELEMISSYTNESYLNGSETVYWVIPKVNTMINFEPYVSNLQTTLKSGNKFRKLNKFIKDISHYYVIGQTNRKDGEKYKYSINYQIKEYYTKQAVKNTIYCFVYKNNQMAQTNLTLTFGQHGTAGTDYTLTLGLGNLYDKDWNIKGGADTALTFGSSNYREIVFALYDENNKEITLTDNQKNAIINRWITGHKDGYLYGADRAKKYLDFLTQQSNNKYSRIAVRVPSKDSNGISNWTRDHIGGIIFKISFSANYVFTQYLPLHVKYSSGYDLEGSDSIIYSDSGTNPVYYKDRFDLIGRDPKNVLTIEISSTSKNEELKKYLPTFNDKFKLCPSPLYVDIGEGISVILKEAGVAKYIFSLLIMQNAYGVPTINKWDGSLTIDNENNQILSAMVGAGKKDTGNKFSGVLMGEVKTEGNTLYGLYGYDKGIQSYGFKIDGTAFIGKSGTGRILFNGNKGIIESANYKDGTGTQLDLSNGKLVSHSSLTLKGATGSEIRFEGNHKDPNDKTKTVFGSVKIGLSNQDEPYLWLQRGSKKDKNGRDDNYLIRFGSQNAYLQSYDYENGKSGTKLDLANGSLISYGALTLKGASGSILEFRGNHIDPQDSKGKKTVEGLVQMGLDSSDRPYLYLKENDKFLIQFGALNAYLQSYGYEKPTKETGVYSKKGTRIDLRAGSIVSEKFVLKGGDAYFKGEGEFEGKITATSGLIGGWKIDKNSLKAGNITINPAGSIKSSGGDNGNWSINDDGSARFSKITITGGELTLNGISYTGGGTVPAGQSGWYNTNYSGLTGYIDQRISTFLNANLWPVVKDCLNVYSSNNNNLLEIKNAHFSKLYAGFFSSISAFTGGPSSTDSQKEKLPFRIVVGDNNINGNRESKSFYDLVEYCIGRYISNGGIGLDGGVDTSGSGDNTGKKLGDPNWVRSPGNNYPKYANKKYPYPWSNCTWSVYEIVYTLHGKQWTDWGDASRWLWRARREGYDVYEGKDTTQIESKCVIVYESGPQISERIFYSDDGTWHPGHVVYVISVNKEEASRGDFSSCHFIEGNYLHHWREDTGNPFTGRWNNFIGCIYLGYGHSNMPNGTGSSNGTVTPD